MISGIIGRKMGMTQLFAADGTVTPVTVIKAGRDYEVIAENDLGEAISASPVFANGMMYLRSFDALWAIKNK